jgi:hypothetical protein
MILVTHCAEKHEAEARANSTAEKNESGRQIEQHALWKPRPWHGRAKSLSAHRTESRSEEIRVGNGSRIFQQEQPELRSSDSTNQSCSEIKKSRTCLLEKQQQLQT